MNGSLTDTAYLQWLTFYTGPSVNGQQLVAPIAKPLVAQLKTPWGDASPSLQPPHRRVSGTGAGGCGVPSTGSGHRFRYPLCGMLRPATPRGLFRSQG